MELSKVCQNKPSDVINLAWAERLFTELWHLKNIRQGTSNGKRYQDSLWEVMDPVFLELEQY